MPAGPRPRFIWLVHVSAIATIVVFAYAGWLIVRRGDGAPVL